MTRLASWWDEPMNAHPWTYGLVLAFWLGLGWLYCWGGSTTRYLDWRHKCRRESHAHPWTYGLVLAFWLGLGWLHYRYLGWRHQRRRESDTDRCNCNEREAGGAK